MSKNKQRSSDGVDKIDQSKLRSNSYSEKLKDWKTVYVIRNTRFDNKVAEIRATSFIHACTLIGWRPRHVTLISSHVAE
jgi:hypothetical protein